MTTLHTIFVIIQSYILSPIIATLWLSIWLIIFVFSAVEIHTRFTKYYQSSQKIIKLLLYYLHITLAIVTSKTLLYTSNHKNKSCGVGIIFKLLKLPDLDVCPLIMKKIIKKNNRFSIKGLIKYK